uniref:Uncharacterized protein n=1 Tax=Romanomermis culicivorax TaxID=13658 RepID=A0A915KQ33_ROMCU
MEDFLYIITLNQSLNQSLNESFKSKHQEHHTEDTVNLVAWYISENPTRDFLNLIT